MKLVLPVISILLLLVIVGGAAFYFGQKSTVGLQINPSPAVTQINNISAPTATPKTVQTNPNPDTTITSGGVLVFSAYSLQAPSDWASNKQTGVNMDTLTLSKGTYKIIISQVAGDGGGCTYPGDAPAQMAQNFTSFVEITNPNGYLFRRGQVQPNTWTVCQKNTSDGSFGFPTSFGNITITTPIPADSTITAEIDSILASLNKK